MIELFRFSHQWVVKFNTYNLGINTETLGYFSTGGELRLEATLMQGFPCKAN